MAGDKDMDKKEEEISSNSKDSAKDVKSSQKIPKEVKTPSR